MRLNCNISFPSSIRLPRSSIPRRPRPCGTSWGGRWVHPGCPTARCRRTEKKRSGRRSKSSDSSTPNRMDGRKHRTRNLHYLENRETTMKKILPALVAAVGVLALTAVSSVAQEWPQRGTIRMIVPYPAGGGTDVVARIVAKFLAERLQQTIIVENRGGANGQVGLRALKQSPPDGYTMAMTSDSPMKVNPWFYKSIPYDPMKDFIHVTSVIRLPSLLAVHPDRKSAG